MQETGVPSLACEDPLEKEMATHSSIFVWETHRQQSLGATVHGIAKKSDMIEPCMQVRILLLKRQMTRKEKINWFKETKDRTLYLMEFHKRRSWYN